MNTSTNKIADIRQEYALASLRKSDLASNPFQQFHNWFQEAVTSEIDDVNAMTLSTVDASGKPHARIVLLKGIEEDKVVFFTNYDSDKGQEIAANPHVSLVFYWKELQRQVRIEGSISKLDEQASTAYFHSRPKESQIGAWASNQSRVLNNREELESRFADLQQQYMNLEVPKPPHWGGYAITPSMIEFWQGRASRLHDRFRYQIDENGTWIIRRLNP